MLLTDVYFTAALHSTTKQRVCMHLKSVLMVNLSFDFITGGKKDNIYALAMLLNKIILDKMLYMHIPLDVAIRSICRIPMLCFYRFLIFIMCTMRCPHLFSEFFIFFFQWDYLHFGTITAKFQLSPVLQIETMVLMQRPDCNKRLDVTFETSRFALGTHQLFYKHPAQSIWSNAGAAFEFDYTLSSWIPSNNNKSSVRFEPNVLRLISCHSAGENLATSLADVPGR